MEHFTVTLLYASGGARVGSNRNATLQISENDYPIHFAGTFYIIVFFVFFPVQPSLPGKCFCSSQFAK